MSESIYRFFRGKWKPAWHRLPAEEQTRMLQEMSDAHKRAGIKNALGSLMYTCWSSEWALFGVEEFESLEAIQRWRDEMERMGWFDYIEQENMIGIPISAQT